MRLLFAISAVVATLAAPALAQPRPDSLTMTCTQARSLVARSGAIVLGSGPMIYDRFVADIRFCPLGDVTRPATVQTRDMPACMVGNTCVQPQTDRMLLID